MSDTANPAVAGSDSVSRSLTLSQAAQIDFEEAPDEPSVKANPAEVEERQEVEGPDDADTGEEADDETVEADDAEEAPDGDEGADDQATPDAEEATDDHLVVMQDGKKLSVKELRAGYMKDKDYRRKTHDLSVKERSTAEASQRVTAVTEAVADFLSKFVPDAPDPALAMSINPQDQANYLRQKTMHEQAMEQVSRLVRIGDVAKETNKAITAEQRRDRIDAANAKLVEALPFLSDGKKRDEFNRKTFETAQRLGFKPEELANNFDHRFFVLGHYARLGLEAEAAAGKAREKVKSVPAVTPRPKPGQRGDASRVIENRKAMARLAKTGSFRDALAVDFD